MSNGRFMMAPRCLYPAEPVLPDRLGHRILDQRAGEPAALVELPCLEQCVGKLDARRCIRGVESHRPLQLFGRLGMPGESLQNETVQVVPLERPRCERLRALIDVVRRIPLFPGMQEPCESARRACVSRSCHRVPIGAADRLASRRREQIERGKHQRSLGLRPGVDPDGEQSGNNDAAPQASRSERHFGLL